MLFKDPIQMAFIGKTKLIGYLAHSFIGVLQAGFYQFQFDQLYAEAEFKRRQMSISFHDRIGGTHKWLKPQTT